MTYPRLALLVAAACVPVPVAMAGEMPADRYIVHFSDRVSAAAARHPRVSHARSTRIAQPVHVRTLAAGGEVFDVHGLDPAVLALMPGVIDIEEDRIVTPAGRLTTLWHRQWYMHDPRVGIDAEVAWRYTKGAGSVVAVLDTGIAPHPQLVGQLLPGYDFVSDAAAARDGDGRDANPADEGDWSDAGECGSSTASESSWHGTHVAGLVAARSPDGRGMLGVAPEAKVIPVRVMGKCGGRLSDVADAIVWASGGELPGVPAIARRADVINLSLRTPGACGTALATAIGQARSRGVAVVAAAGNDGIRASAVSPSNCAGVVSVNALARDGSMAWYSNHGDGVTLAAPGGSLTTFGADDILSTVDGGKRGSEGRPLLKYYAGTSMAAPQVSALVALMRSADPAIGVEAITRQLVDNARPLPGPCPKGCGAGLMDAGATVDAVVEDRGKP